MKNKIFYMILFFVLSLLLYWFYYLISYYITLYHENITYYKESQEIIKNSTIEKEKEYKDRLEKLKNERNNIILDLVTLDDINSKPIERKELLSLHYSDQDNINVIENIKNEYLEISLNKRLEILKQQKLDDLEKESIYWKSVLLSIPKINLEIDTLSLYDKEDVNEENLYEKIDTYLEEGPIRYPNRDILENWVTIIYSHSAQNKWYKNYSYFRKLPLLTEDDLFSFKTNLYEYDYKVIKSLELETSEVIKLSQKYEKLFPDKKMVFLVTCYPLNTSDKRWGTIWVLDTKEKL